MAELPDHLSEFRDLLEPETEELIESCRGNIYFHSTNTGRFIKGDSETVTFEKAGTFPWTSQIKSFFQPPQTDIGRMTESAININLLELPFDDIKLPVVLQTGLKDVTKDWQSLLFEGNQTSATGRLLCSQDKHSILLETPVDCFPYLYLSMSCIEAASNPCRWRGVFAYEAEDGRLDWQVTQLGSRWNRFSSKSTVKPAPFDVFACMVRDVISEYIIDVQNVAMGIVSEIEEIEDSLQEDPHPGLSKLLRQLNNLNQTITILNLDKQFAFSVKAATWANDVLRPSRYTLLQFGLLELAEMLERYHPDRLRESIAEVRQHITDVAAEEKQARDELRQLREDARAEREEKFLEQSIRIAEETKRNSRTMRGIAWVTITFLPATFVSSFFGMNSVNGIAGNVPFDEASRSVWLFFAVAIPISGMVLFTFYVWNKKEAKKDAQKKEEDEEKTQAGDKDKTE